MLPGKTRFGSQQACGRCSLLLSFLLALLFCPLLAFAAELTLTVRVTGVVPRQGQVILSLFDSETSYLKTPYKKLTAPVTDQAQVSFTIDDLAAGTYAASAVYDRDGDGKMKRNFIGMPREPVGMSNNAKGMFGPPRFQDTRFDFNSDLEISIQLTNVK